MVYLTALLPVADGVAAYAALRADADRARAIGDPRARGQVMADALVTRLTGCATSADGRPVVPVSIGLVMTDRALFAGAHDSATISEHGPVPADLARQLVLRNLDSRTRTWVRRLYTHPDSGELAAMDARQRRFPVQLASFLRYRDQWCRTPWCNAPIRQADHVVEASSGGPTSAADGQGLCEACNYAKEAPGWTPPTSPRTRRPHRRHHHPHRRPLQISPPPLVRQRHPAYQFVGEGRWILIA